MQKTSIAFYITYKSAGLILIINIKKGVMEDKIPANYPGDIDINSIPNKAYVSDSKSKVLYEIDG
jgi:hypothetical protein